MRISEVASQTAGSPPPGTAMATTYPGPRTSQASTSSTAGFSIEEPSSKSNCSVESRVRDEDLTGRVDARLQPLVLLVRTAPAKDDEREASRCDELPVVALFHPVGEELGETDVLTNDRPQPFAAVAAQHGPQLER